MNPNSDNFNRPEALLNARRSERPYGELGVDIIYYISVANIYYICDK